LLAEPLTDRVLLQACRRATTAASPSSGVALACA